MKRKDLIKKLEKKEKELKVAIDLGEKIGKEMVKTLSIACYAGASDDDGTVQL